MDAFLHVETSLTGRRWVGPDMALDLAAQALVQQTGLPDALCRVLARRGVSAPDAAGFLAPRLRDLLPDPLCLRDMGAAAAPARAGGGPKGIAAPEATARAWLSWVR